MRFGWGGFFSRVFLFDFFFAFQRTQPAASMRQPCLIYLSTSTGVRTGCHYLICLSVCVSVWVTFVVFTDCESCTRPISTNLGSTGAGQYGLTRDVFPCMPSRVGRGHRAAVAFVGCFGWGGFFSRVFSMSLHFQIRTSRAVSVDSVKGLRQPANLPAENSCPRIPTRCTV